MSIKVGVRVRPFNAREKTRESRCVIEMNSMNQTKIFDEVGNEKTFTFDHSFWSHDGFRTLEDGYLEPESDKYADQKFVFNAVGKQILDNAWEGYHCCLFAYGQTGSGKSYSMVGYGANKGIVPISCDEIFSRIEKNTTPEKSFEVQVSMLEIYNEKVQDLLIPAQKRPQHGLKIRESKVLGIFVEGLSKHPVRSYAEISKKMDEGYENRTIGSTLMNATSSRAHTIVTIEFKQLTMIAGRKSEKLSMINLVDLAGSERAGSTGATGDRLKEGCNINKSLLVLGNVINALADKAIGKGKNILPPYRDSALTRILQNALGGNSKTVMICALSPASINYEETLSTLRYADRAKKIQNKAIINESEHDKMVRMLKEENTGLKKMLEDLQKKLLGGGSLQSEEDKQAYNELKEQYDANLNVMKDMEKTFEEKIEEAKKYESLNLGEVVDMNKPHLIVLNEDPQLSYKLKYSLVELPVYVGRKNGKPQPQIVLSGIGIKVNHAIFEIVDEKEDDEKKDDDKNEENKEDDEEKKNEINVNKEEESKNEESESKKEESENKEDENKKEENKKEENKNDESESKKEEIESKNEEIESKKEESENKEDENKEDENKKEESENKKEENKNDESENKKEEKKEIDLTKIKIRLKANENGAKEYIFINGKKIPESGKILENKDRIVFGTNSIMIYMQSSDGKDFYDIDWEKAQYEIQEEIDKNNKLQSEEIEKKKQEEFRKLKEEYENKRKEMEDELKKKSEEFQNQLNKIKENEEKKELEKIQKKEEEKMKEKLNKLNEEENKKKQEYENYKQHILSLEESKNKTIDFIKIDEKLENTFKNLLKKISKMNVIIKELKREINIEIVIHKNLITNSAPNIFVRIENFEEGYVYNWPINTFYNRYDIMKEMFNKFEDGELDLFSLKNEDDPLYEKESFTILGYSFFKLEPVAYLMSNESTVAVINPAGNVVGHLTMDIVPVDENGNEFEEIPEDPFILIGQSLKYKIVFKNLKNLPKNFCKNLFIEYKCFYNENVIKTKTFNVDNNNNFENLEINECFEHEIDFLNKEDIEYFVNEKLLVTIYAVEQIEKRHKKTKEELIKLFKEDEEKMNERNKNEKENLFSDFENIEKNNNIININNDDNKKNHKKKKDDKKEKKKKDCIIF